MSIVKAMPKIKLKHTNTFTFQDSKKHFNHSKQYLIKKNTITEYPILVGIDVYCVICNGILE